MTDIFVGVCAWHPPSPPIPMGGAIVTGSGNSNGNELGLARNTDIVIGYCGHPGTIVSGSGDININNLGAARTGDVVVGWIIGTLVTGSGNINSN